MKKYAALFAVVFAGTAYAADSMDWKACEKEIKEYKCTGDDKAVWMCLEMHDEKLGDRKSVV